MNIIILLAISAATLVSAGANNGAGANSGVGTKMKLIKRPRKAVFANDTSTDNSC